MLCSSSARARRRDGQVRSIRASSIGPSHISNGSQVPKLRWLLPLRPSASPLLSDSFRSRVLLFVTGMSIQESDQCRWRESTLRVLYVLDRVTLTPYIWV